MVQMAASNQELSSWNGFQWRRKMESFGDKDQSIVAVGAGNEIEGIWSVMLDDIFSVLKEANIADALHGTASTENSPIRVAKPHMR